jgi:ligand-binding sensor domain-containing protein
LDKFDRETKQFNHYFNNTSGQYDFNYWIRSFYEDTAGMIWLGSNHGLIKFDHRLNTSTQFTNDPKNPNSSASNDINSISEDLSGNLWIAHYGNGVDVFDKSTEVFKHYTYDDNNIQTSLNSNKALSVLCEQSGTVWVATMSGLNKLNRPVQPFVTISKDNIWQIINGRNGIIYIKTDKGFKKYDKKTGQMTTTSLGGDLMYVDNNNNLWLNKYESGLYKQDTFGRITHFYSSDQKEFKFYVCHIYESPEGIIWIGTFADGLFFIDPVTQYVRSFNKTKHFINIVYEDSYGCFGCTANGGLFRYSKDRETVTHYIFESEDSAAVTFTTIVDIHEDKDGNLWFGSNTGLNKYDRSTDKFTLLRGKIGPSSYNALSILEDDHGKLWLSNPQGVSKYDPETNLFRHYDASYGLPENGLGLYWIQK